MPVGWNNIELFTVPPAGQVLVRAAATAFWHALESLRWLLVNTQLCIPYFSGFLTRDNMSLKSRVDGLVIMECVVRRNDGQSVHFFGPFALALYQDMVVHGCGTRVIT